MSVEALRRLDFSLSHRIHRLELGWLDYPLVLPGLLFGEYGVPWLIGIGWLTLGWRITLAFTLCSLGLLILTTSIKHLTGRRRPEPLGTRAVPVRSLVNNPAFPSGDSAQVGLVVVFLTAVGPFEDLRRWLFVPLAPLCMFARVYFGAHWVGDTVAGVAMGLGVGWLGLWLAYDWLS